MTFNEQIRHVDFKASVVEKIRADLRFTRCMTKDMVLRFDKSNLSRYDKGVQLLYIFQQDMLPQIYKHIMNVSSGV